MVLENKPRKILRNISLIVSAVASAPAPVPAPAPAPVPAPAKDPTPVDFVSVEEAQKEE